MDPMAKVGRPKGTRVALCPCGWRITGRGKTGTCVECGRRVTFPKVRRPKTKAKATA